MYQRSGKKGEGQKGSLEQPEERNSELLQKMFAELGKKLPESLNTKLTAFDERMDERLVKLNVEVKKEVKKMKNSVNR